MYVILSHACFLKYGLYGSRQDIDEWFREELRKFFIVTELPWETAHLALLPVRARLKIIRPYEERIENVGTSQSCMVSNFRSICKQTVGNAEATVQDRAAKLRVLRAEQLESGAGGAGEEFLPEEHAGRFWMVSLTPL